MRTIILSTSNLPQIFLTFLIIKSTFCSADHFQTKGNVLSVEKPCSVPSEKIILESNGPVIGSNLAATIDRIIYVVPEAYGNMDMSDRYAVARLVGKLTHLKDKREADHSSHRAGAMGDNLSLLWGSRSRSLRSIRFPSFVR